jgi:hypothetical protein
MIKVITLGLTATDLMAAAIFGSRVTAPENELGSSIVLALLAATSLLLSLTGAGLAVYSLVGPPTPEYDTLQTLAADGKPHFE